MRRASSWMVEGETYKRSVELSSRRVFAVAPVAPVQRASSSQQGASGSFLLELEPHCGDVILWEDGEERIRIKNVDLIGYGCFGDVLLLQTRRPAGDGGGFANLAYVPDSTHTMQEMMAIMDIERKERLVASNLVKGLVSNATLPPPAAAMTHESPPSPPSPSLPLARSTQTDDTAGNASMMEELLRATAAAEERAYAAALLLRRREQQLVRFAGASSRRRTLSRALWAWWRGSAADRSTTEEGREERKGTRPRANAEAQPCSMLLSLAAANKNPTTYPNAATDPEEVEARRRLLLAHEPAAPPPSSATSVQRWIEKARLTAPATSALLARKKRIAAGLQSHGHPHSRLRD